MNHQTESSSTLPDDPLRAVSSIVKIINRDENLIRQLAEFQRATLVLSATDTGRRLMIVLTKQGIQLNHYDGTPFDVEILATEQVHWAVLCGQMDADSAFFAGKMRVHGSVSIAFRVRSRFLGLVQWHLAQLRD